jgi:transposase InsO family protein
LDLKHQGKLQVFICIDLHTNKVLSYAASTKIIGAVLTARVFKNIIADRFPNYPEEKPTIPVIIHTDRGSQFKNKTYYNFIKQHEGLVELSMYRQATPKDNAVMERFMRTFKGHIIVQNTIQDEFDQALALEPKFKSYRKKINKFIKNLNQRINKKTFPETPDNKDKRVHLASQLMLDPIYTKAFSEIYGDDPRLVHVDQYKQKTGRTYGYIQEIAAMRAEVIDKTSFDNEEQDLYIATITDRLDELYGLIEANPAITKQYVEDALEPLHETIQEIDRKIDILLPKPRKERVVQKLRDPVDQELFPIFLESAGAACKRQNKLRSAQLGSVTHFCTT